MPAQVGRNETAGLLPLSDPTGLGMRPVPAQQRSEQGHGPRIGIDRTRGPAVRADDAPGGQGDRTMRTGLTAPGTLREGRGPAGDGKAAQQVGVEHQPVLMLIGGQ